VHDRRGPDRIRVDLRRKRPGLSRAVEMCNSDSRLHDTGERTVEEAKATDATDDSDSVEAACHPGLTARGSLPAFRVALHPEQAPISLPIFPTSMIVPPYLLVLSLIFHPPFVTPPFVPTSSQDICQSHTQNPVDSLTSLAFSPSSR
jgi:hypothetical protein